MEKLIFGVVIILVVVFYAIAAYLAVTLCQWAFLSITNYFWLKKYKREWTKNHPK